MYLVRSHIFTPTNCPPKPEFSCCEPSDPFLSPCCWGRSPAVWLFQLRATPHPPAHPARVPRGSEGSHSRGNSLQASAETAPYPCGGWKRLLQPQFPNYRANLCSGLLPSPAGGAAQLLTLTQRQSGILAQHPGGNISPPCISSEPACTRRCGQTTKGRGPGHR